MRSSVDVTATSECSLSSQTDDTGHKGLPASIDAMASIVMVTPGIRPGVKVERARVQQSEGEVSRLRREVDRFRRETPSGGGGGGGGGGEG
jgi:hypothetical protein